MRSLNLNISFPVDISVHLITAYQEISKMFENVKKFDDVFFQFSLNYERLELTLITQKFSQKRD